MDTLYLAAIKKAVMNHPHLNTDDMMGPYTHTCAQVTCLHPPRPYGAKRKASPGLCSRRPLWTKVFLIYSQRSTFFSGDAKYFEKIQEQLDGAKAAVGAAAVCTVIYRSFHAAESAKEKSDLVEDDCYTASMRVYVYIYI